MLVQSVRVGRFRVFEFAVHTAYSTEHFGAMSKVLDIPLDSSPVFVEQIVPSCPSRTLPALSTRRNQTQDSAALVPLGLK
eukprot:1340347-Rhodomonas_salina.2